jgi:hypothetical protein
MVDGKTLGKNVDLNILQLKKNRGTGTKVKKSVEEDCDITTDILHRHA